MANISKNKRTELLLRIKQARQQLKRNVEEVDRHLLVNLLDDLETELERQNYGLVFEDHHEQIHEILKTHNPVLVEQKDLFLDNGGQTNLLIEGENLAALRFLQKTHKEKIDLVYIDPPYNTGKKWFPYNDSFKDCKDEFSHSKWLSFMDLRLKEVPSLLSERGLIMISIGAKEVFSLKLLCDHIFGEANFISCVSCQTNPGGNKSGIVESTMQYLLVYAKCHEKTKGLGLHEEPDASGFPLEDEKGKYKRGIQLEKWGSCDTIHTNPNLGYSIYYNPENYHVTHLFDYNKEELKADRNTEIKYMPADPALVSKGYVCIRPRTTNSGENGRWRLGIDTFYERLKKNDIIFKKTRKGYRIYEKERKKNEKFVKAKDFIPWQIARQESRELKNILGENSFIYPKPIAFMEHIIESIQNKEALVLDFFAGSGTTGHAVLNLNAKDGGRRSFILCTNNEGGICRDVAYERLKTALTGIRGDGSVYSQGAEGSLKYMVIDYRKKNIT